MRTRIRNHQKTSRVSAAVLLLVLVGAPSGADTGPTAMTATAASVPDDHAIADMLEQRLLRDRLVPADFLDVRVEQGIVTLTGTVRTLRERERALALATALRGVRAVVNRVRVKPLTRPDEAIAEDVEAALKADAAADAYDVDVHVRDGVVTLTGSVEGWAERELTRRIATDVRGVKAVRSELALVFPERRRDEEIAADIKARLGTDAWLFDDPVRVKVEDGHVVLSGAVGSAMERARARYLAGVAGVRSIDAHKVVVDPVLRDEFERRPAAWPRTDEDIRRAVKAALRHDPRVGAGDVEVTAESGVVTLTGTVTALSAKQAARADATNTVGVLHVRNLLKVTPGGGPGQRDETVADRVRQALNRSPHLRERQIQVEVRHGHVVLKGRVASAFERTRATTLASGIDGVVAVSNQLRVPRGQASPAPHDPDRALWRAVHQELWWAPSLYDERIIVDVEDGVVTLRGAVDSLRERQLATEHAYAAGATRVRNRLRVEYAPGFFTAASREGPRGMAFTCCPAADS